MMKGLRIENQIEAVPLSLMKGLKFFNNIFVRNILAFVAFLCYSFMVAFTYNHELTTEFFLKFLLFDGSLFIWFTLHNRILFERLLLKRKYLLYAVGVLIALFLDLVLINQITTPSDMQFSNTAHAISFVLYTAGAFFVYITVKYFQERKTFYQLSILKRDIELQQLKTQLNPHFLFNSLNNVYSYNLENNAYGNDLILKLSHLMRFIVESTSKEFISINEETAFIDNYVSFETERLGYRCDILYHKNILFPERMVPPLILFPFIENAFKHGTDSLSQTKIEIEITDSEKAFGLYVRNHMINNGSNSTKTGLTNIVRRLDLLFPEKYKLNVNREDGFYTVRFSLETT